MASMTREEELELELRIVRDELFTLQTKVVENLPADLAVIVADPRAELMLVCLATTNNDSGRGACPLCGESPPRYPHQVQGWTLPTGLLRHLGGHGDNQRCYVMTCIDRTVRRRFSLGKEGS